MPKVPDAILHRENVRRASDLALSGDPEASLKALIELAPDDLSVHFPIAELLAYLGQWDEAVPYASTFLAQFRVPDSVAPDVGVWQQSGHAVNIALATLGVVPPMVRVLVRAGEVGGDWTALRQAASDGVDAVRSLGEALTIESPYQHFLRRFADPDLTTAPIDLLGPLAMNRHDAHAAYERKKVHLLKNGYSLDSDGREFLCRAAEVDSPQDIVELYDGDRTIPWHVAISVVRSFARLGRFEEAWNAADRHIGLWREYPVLPGRHASTVTPLEFITFTPRDFLSPSHCRKILNTPRGESSDRAERERRTLSHSAAEFKGIRRSTGRYFRASRLSSDPSICAWQKRLRKLSRALLAADLAKPQDLPSELYRTGYFGFPPAAELDVRQAEDRLGVRLPNSYRTFLLASNGCHNLGRFLWPSGELVPVHKIARYTGPFDLTFHEQHLDEDEEAAWTSWLNFDVTVAQDIDDLEDSLERVVRNAIMIAQPSAPGQARRLLLLLPDLTTDDGEWVCLLYGQWMWNLSGFFAYPTFADFIAQFESMAEP